MTQNYTNWIEETIESRHGVGYLTYMSLGDYFDDLSVEESQNILMEYAMERIDTLFVLYSLKCRKIGTNSYFNLLLSDDRLCELMEDPEEYEFDIDSDLTVLMVADQEKGYNNYFVAKAQNDLIEEFCNDKEDIKFIESENPIRAQIRRDVIGNRKLKAAEKSQSKISQTQQPKKTISYRDNSKAGKQGKLNLSKSQSRTAQEAGLGVKRKREEPQKKLETKTKEKWDISENEKRIKNKEKDPQNKIKAQFDSNLYSFEESDGEKEEPEKQNPFVQETINAQKGRKRIIEDSDEEKQEIEDSENKHPNGNQDIEMEDEEKPKKKMIKKRVTRTEEYEDDEGFICHRQVEEFVEVEVEYEKAKPKRPNKEIETKTAKYKPPSKGQASLRSFFGRG